MASHHKDVEAFRRALKSVVIQNREDFLRYVKLATITDIGPYPSANVALVVTFCQKLGLVSAFQECSGCGAVFTFFVESEGAQCRLRWRGPKVFGCDACLEKRLSATQGTISTSTSRKLGWLWLMPW